jgi:hypothetical protein
MPEKLAKLVADRLGISELAAVPNRYAAAGYRFFCPGLEAVDRWRQLRALVDQSGYWPVILGNDKEASRVLEFADQEHGQPVTEILREAASQSAERWLKERQQSNLNALQKTYGADWQKTVEQLHGEWPERVHAVTRFTIPFERVGSGPPKAKVTIGLFPTKDGCEVPAQLNFGGWNECPDPAVHVRLMRKWFEDYGAELVGMNGDVIEMSVIRPPATREDALRLAEQQFLYCEDIVLQGTETMERLAAGLLGNNVWFFWWD